MDKLNDNKIAVWDDMVHYFDLNKSKMNSDDRLKWYQNIIGLANKLEVK